VKVTGEMKKISMITLLFLLGASGIDAQTKVGTTAANFLTIPVGPRATGMGGAFTAVADDATAAFWNAGGLSRLPDNEFTVTHTGWFVGTSVNWLGLAVKLNEDNALAFSVHQLNYGKEEITTAEQPNGTGQQWDAQDLAFGVSYARNLSDRFSIGGTVKYVNQRIWNENASAFALDVGLLFRTQYNDLKIGMNIANFGTELKLDGKDLLQPVDIDPAHAGNNNNIVATINTQSWTLPLLFTVGLGMDVVHSGAFVWTLDADAVYPNNQTAYFNAGTEVTWGDLVAVRTGYNSLFKDSPQEGLTAGIGIRYAIGAVITKVDYSYMDYGIFNAISRYSLTVSF
jgi:hypothetical protein